jgi:hypothetical protein
VEGFGRGIWWGDLVGVGKCLRRCVGGGICWRDLVEGIGGRIW